MPGRVEAVDAAGQEGDGEAVRSRARTGAPCRRCRRRRRRRWSIRDRRGPTPCPWRSARRRARPLAPRPARSSAPGRAARRSTPRIQSAIGACRPRSSTPSGQSRIVGQQEPRAGGGRGHEGLHDVAGAQPRPPAAGIRRRAPRCRRGRSAAPAGSIRRARECRTLGRGEIASSASSAPRAVMSMPAARSPGSANSDQAARANA